MQNIRQFMRVQKYFFKAFITMTHIVATPISFSGCGSGNPLLEDSDQAKLDSESTYSTDGATDEVDSESTLGEFGIDGLSGQERIPEINWVHVAAGNFTFGSSEDVPCRAPTPETPFQVTLTRPFVMADSELTLRQWKSLGLRNPSSNNDSEKPVTFASYFEAAVWCNKLSKLEGFAPCYDLSTCKNEFGTGCTNEEGCFDDTNFHCADDIHNYADVYSCPGYRLPTSAEWEYAAKAGTTGHTYNGDVHYVALSFCEEESSLEDIAWYCNNAGNEIHSVKEKKPNSWGLYDMLGNVYEWTDYHFHGQALDNSKSPGSALTDPIGPATGDSTEMRGGSYKETGCYVRPARPYFFDSNARRNDTGFRPVRTIFGDEADAAEANPESDSDSDSDSDSE